MKEKEKKIDKRYLMAIADAELGKADFYDTYDKYLALSQEEIDELWENSMLVCSLSWANIWSTSCSALAVCWIYKKARRLHGLWR